MFKIIWSILNKQFTLFIPIFENVNENTNFMPR
jgi:hypothetical protein